MEFGKDDIVIEVDNGKGDSWVFPPCHARGPLRGRYDLAKMPRGITRRANAMFAKPIPGMYVWLNLKERRGGIIDPLSLPENAGLAGEIAGHLRQPAVVPLDETKEANMPPNTVSTWWHWMREAITRGAVVEIDGARRQRAPACVVVLNGHLLEESKRPSGRVQIDFMSVDPYNWKDKRGTPVFMDEFEDRRRRDLPTSASAPSAAE